MSLIGLIEGSFCLRCCNGETPHDPLVHRFAKEDDTLPVDRAGAPVGDHVGGKARKQQDRVGDKPRGRQDHAESFGAAGQSPLSDGRACTSDIMACRVLAVANPL